MFAEQSPCSFVSHTLELTPQNGRPGAGRAVGLGRGVGAGVVDLEELAAGSVNCWLVWRPSCRQSQSRMLFPLCADPPDTSKHLCGWLFQRIDPEEPLGKTNNWLS
mmetsp:Transcript_90366/g.219050  ORF Transcript_90366/g.219050 Transcript_90366/m.219050 type:complete len:106 (+) Transcript_90366:853-1170(+)